MADELEVGAKKESWLYKTLDQGPLHTCHEAAKPASRRYLPQADDKGNKLSTENVSSTNAGGTKSAGTLHGIRTQLSGKKMDPRVSPHATVALSHFPRLNRDRNAKVSIFPPLHTMIFLGVSSNPAKAFRLYSLRGESAISLGALLGRIKAFLRSTAPVEFPAAFSFTTLD